MAHRMRVLVGGSSMHAFPGWNLDASQILSRGELAQVLADLRTRPSIA
jgi:hypothetical protein